MAEALLWLLQEEIFVRPTFVVTIFQGYRVLACSWEVGGRLYAVSRGGVVVALDYPLCHFELRLVTTSCKDAFGMDADRLEFRFLSAADRLDVACSVLLSATFVAGGQQGFRTHAREECGMVQGSLCQD